MLKPYAKRARGAFFLAASGVCFVSGAFAAENTISAGKGENP